MPVGAEARYAYLLGVYLGDGYLAYNRRGVYALRLAMDAKYPGLIGRAREAISTILPRNRVGAYSRHAQAAVDVVSYSKLWPLLLPQHGPGKKHERRIELEEWQRAITSQHPRDLIRGLLHADGCRFVARQRSRGKIYMYPRYAFSNRSEDIKRILTEHLDRIDVAWTAVPPVTIQVARRQGVAILEEFVGPKA